MCMINNGSKSSLKVKLLQGNEHSSFYSLATKYITSLTCYIHDNSSSSSAGQSVSYTTCVTT